MAVARAANPTGTSGLTWHRLTSWPRRPTSQVGEASPQARVQEVAQGVAEQVAARTVKVIASPGNTTSHQGGLNDSASTPPSMLPQLGVGGGMPMPRKLRPASVVIATPMLAETITRNGAMHCGATWRSRIRSGDAPTVRAAST